MDPVEQNQQAAFIALQEYVAARRVMVDRVNSQQHKEDCNASMMHEQPEFMLPFLVQVIWNLHLSLYI